MKLLLPILAALLLFAPASMALAQAPSASDGAEWRYVAAQVDLFRGGATEEETTAALDLAMSVFPNPITSAGVVRFTLERTQHVTLDVFDLLGRRVLQQELGVLPVGDHEVGLDLRRLPTGLYIVRLTGDAGARATVRVTKAASA